MILAVASHTSSLVPWVLLLLALVAVQVLVIVVMRRRRAHHRMVDPLPSPPPTPLGELTPRPARSVAPPSVDWPAVEADLADMIGPAVRALMAESEGSPVDAAAVQALVDDLVRRLSAARGLDAASADALARSLGDRLLEIVVPAPVT